MRQSLNLIPTTPSSAFMVHLKKKKKHNYKHPYGVLTNVGPVRNQPMQDYHVANVEELVGNTNARKKILYAQLRHLSIESWDGGWGGN